MVESTSYLYKAENPEHTVSLAARLAPYFRPGTVITLDGDLGAGKTAFSKAVARAIGVSDVVNSPTFTIIKEYEGERFPFYHMDVYRLSQDEADELGLDEYFFGEGITLVEWSSLITELLPEDRLAIAIRHTEDGNPEGRMFTLTPHGNPYKEWCEQLKENGILQ
ncbi:tRNA (adenosine(37)-N6)-threonylcarbamoyltransferase complex ATPase subunit type 1 TsaE [Paenibacillus doosanensis]|uniref:tRNA threonylcarbamoyladenosine biosynthesis protein TsaE n=1 Tax=Paenibacillus konkukensis TaxID=2020716 RepID=A0ABY4RRQ4_9BACL|nr:MULTISPECIES: tRNA (adenosine(37)-N6)-threonylcarbamoyltransferase complex ATPase subunit type 1 TsaE [Paenibacillus]MCS7463242.1 tRNA (adenosine(37)-N6)-threonylcarbamoyltransferase complex ATPase subunit type 1 TsaE [Paenibacillus doosanensis]UQZ85224.1 tRNA threonylcarbamoyladenosine biosynthesis protein TsaE [Paenibacillus konkukensis]